jgi:hypothetical protein
VPAENRKVFAAMPALSPDAATAIRRMGGMTRRNIPDDDPRYDESRRVIIADRLAAHVRSVLAGSPQLTTEQLDNIADLFTGGAQGK